MVNWQERYDTGDTPWDKGGGHPALAEALSRHSLGGRVFVPGCGYGYDIIDILSHSGDASPEITGVTGIDIAQSAVDTATQRLAADPRISIHLADLFALPKPDYWMKFHWVWEHTCFCAIDPSQRNAYVDAVANTLRPGGHLLGVFYLRPWDTDEENKTLGPPFSTSTEELDKRFATRFEIVDVWEPAATYPGREGREQMRLLRKA